MVSYNLNTKVKEKLMAVTKEKKKDLVSQSQRHKKDTGSPEVQVTVLTEKISTLTNHLSNSPKDYQSQRGLIMLVGKRRRQLNYLKTINTESYRKILDQLAIRG